MEHEKKLEQGDLGDVVSWLQEEGQSPKAPVTEQLCFLWRVLQQREGRLLAVTHDLDSLRSRHTAEMAEVQRYLEHIRCLSEQRDALGQELEKENEELKTQLDQLTLQQDAQMNEVAEMLFQEGLAEVIPSSPSEQVAYLLVERASLLDRDQDPGADLQSQVSAQTKAHSPPASPWDTKSQSQVSARTMVHSPPASLRDSEPQSQRGINHSDQPSLSGAPHRGLSPWERLFGLRKAAHSKRSFVPAAVQQGQKSGVAVEQERARLERDLEEASRRLAMAHVEIRRLTDELESARLTQRAYEPELQDAEQEVEKLRQEVEKLKKCDVVELRKAKELNDRLDQEIRALRTRVRSLDTEKRTLLDMVEQTKQDSAKGDNVRPLDARYTMDKEEGLTQVKRSSVCLQTDPQDQNQYQDRGPQRVAGPGSQLLTKLQERHQQLTDAKNTLEKEVMDLQSQKEKEKESLEVLRNKMEEMEEELNFKREEVKREYSSLQEGWEKLWSKEEEEEEEEEEYEEVKGMKKETKVQVEEVSQQRQKQEVELWNGTGKEQLKLKAGNVQRQRKGAQHHVKMEKAGHLEKESRALAPSPATQDNQVHWSEWLWEQGEVKWQQEACSPGEGEETLNHTELGCQATKLQYNHHHKQIHSQDHGVTVRMEALSPSVKASQQECERLTEQLRQALIELDTKSSKYQEKQRHHKAKLRRAKRTYVHETGWRNQRIQHLERELAFVVDASDKEQQINAHMLAENEKLLQEKRCLLKRLSEEEEVRNDSEHTATTVQRRVTFLENENKRLQEVTLQMSTQIAVLRRTLKNQPSLHSAEVLKKLFHFECPTLTSIPSVVTGSHDMRILWDIIQRSKVGHPKDTAPSLLSTLTTSLSLVRPAELGYLNLTSPQAEEDFLAVSDSLSTDSGEV